MRVKDRVNNPKPNTTYESKLLGFIRSVESVHSYDNLYDGYTKGSNKPLTDMTLNEVYQLQEKMKPSGSSAVGAYQFLNSTLEETAKAMGLSGSEVFNKDLQDRMMTYRLKHTRDFNAFLKGDINDKEFALELSKEFASLPNPKTGKSYYDGDGLNSSLVSSEDVSKLLHNIKKDYLNEEYEKDDSIYGRDIEGNFVILNPNEATKRDLRLSKKAKKDFYSILYPKYFRDLDKDDKKTIFASKSNINNPYYPPELGDYEKNNVLTKEYVISSVLNTYNPLHTLSNLTNTEDSENINNLISTIRKGGIDYNPPKK